MKQDKSMEVLVDNQTAISISHNSMFHGRPSILIWNYFT